MTTYPDWLPRMTLGDRVKQLRTERGWSLRKTGGVSASVILHIEHGYDTSIETLVILADCFDITVQELLAPVDFSEPFKHLKWDKAHNR